MPRLCIVDLMQTMAGASAMRSNGGTWGCAEKPRGQRWVVVFLAQHPRKWGSCAVCPVEAACFSNFRSPASGALEHLSCAVAGVHLGNCGHQQTGATLYLLQQQTMVVSSWFREGRKPLHRGPAKCLKQSLQEARWKPKSKRAKTASIPSCW